MSNVQNPQTFKSGNILESRSYSFSLSVIAFIRTLPNNRVGWVLSDQLVRSGTSVGANIVESRSSSSRKEFKRYREIALKSGNETIYWLQLIRDSNLSKEPKDLDKLLYEAQELCKMLASGILKLKNN